jgi:hypothetical protein
MAAAKNDAFDPLIEALLEYAPQLRAVLASGAQFRWASGANRRLVEGELAAARSAEELGYPHHVQMHIARALQVFREDVAQSERG